MSEQVDWARDLLSAPRLAPYLRRSGQDLPAAIRLYRWNVEVSEAFYTPLHYLEMALRNAVHRQLQEQFGRADWWRAAPLRPQAQDAVRTAARKIAADPNRGRTADDMVTELSLGFWVSLISTRYSRTLWVPGLHRAFPGRSGYPQARLHESLYQVNLLRNRVAHHEPVHHRHLEADHDRIYRLLRTLSEAAVPFLRRCDRVPEVLAVRP